MSLTEAIRFRSLENELNEIEKREFVLCLLNQQNDIITASLFRYFCVSSANNQSEAKNINKIISKIIEKRETKSKYIPQNQLDYLSKPIIGSIACYLDQNNYINFSYCNRSIYLGCNSPNKLQKLQVIDDWTDDDCNNYCYRLINFQLYPSVKSTKLMLSKFNLLQHIKSGINVFNELQKITIYSDRGLSGNSDISYFIKNNNINFQNVKELQIIPSSDNINGNSLLKLLSKFPKLQYLGLWDFLIDIDLNEIKKKIPNLKGLRLRNEDNTLLDSNMIRLFGEQITFLSFEGNEDEFIPALNSVNFIKLQQLYAENIKIKIMNEILKTAVHLKKIRVNFAYNTETKKIKEIKGALINLITCCKLLQYVEFDDINKECSESVLDGIENGLFETRKIKRESLKIRINNKKNAIKNYNDFEIFTLRISRIIHCLQISTIKDWIFIWNFDAIDIDKNIIFKHLRDLSSNITVSINECDGAWIITVGNENCKINGYQESWQMDVD